MPGTAEDLRVNVGDTVHFGYNEYNIEDSDKTVLQRQAAWLQKYPSRPHHRRRPLRRARHPRIQSRARRAPRQRREGISRQPRRLGRPGRHDLLRQGTSDLHGSNEIC